MDKELASFHTYLFSLCVNAAAAQATSTGNRQLKLTRRSWLPAEQYCQVEQASTAPAQTSWHPGLISLAMIATLPTYSVLYNSFELIVSSLVVTTKTLRFGLQPMFEAEYSSGRTGVTFLRLVVK